MGDGTQLTASIWKTWLVPGALLLALTAGVVNSPLLGRVAPSIGFYYFAVFVAGLLLAWRFNSSRVGFCLLVLLLAHRAVEFFSNGQVPIGPGRTAVVVVSILIPLNYIALGFMRERGLTIAGIAPRFGILFVQSVVVAVLCRPENTSAAVNNGKTELPWWTLLAFAGAIAFLILRFVETRKPVETGFVWSLAAVLLWLNFSPIGKIADIYVATAALIITASLIETSYVLAYYDELTGIRGRRAFNEALLALDQQYAIAIVDIDHFKQFNDTYGHDTGDQVLRMVASRLADIGGGAQAFRCGGEEFAIVFHDTSAKEAFEHLDQLRQTIQDSRFKVRGGERRTAQRSEGVDRRKPGSRKLTIAIPQSLPGDLSVTISIGVAEPSTRYRQPEQVIKAADQALYRAKNNGRNRVELASMAVPKVVRKKKALRL